MISQRRCWTFSSSGVWRSVTGRTVSDVSKDRRDSKSKGRAAQYCSLLSTDTCPTYPGGMAVQFDGNYVFGKENLSKWPYSVYIYKRRFTGNRQDRNISKCNGKCDPLPVLHPSREMRRCFTTKPWMLWRKQETSFVCSSSLFQGRTHASPQNCRNNQHTQPNYKQFCKTVCRCCNSVSTRRAVGLRVARHRLDWC